MVFLAVWGVLAVLAAVLAGLYIGTKTTDERAFGLRFGRFFRKVCFFGVALFFLWEAYSFNLLEIVLFLLGVVLGVLPLFRRFHYLFIGFALVRTASFSANSLLFVGSLFVVSSLLFGALEMNQKKSVSSVVRVAGLLIVSLFSLLLPVASSHPFGMFLAGYFVAVK